MKVEILSKYFKKAKLFGNEKAASYIYMLAHIYGDEHELTIKCSDGNSAIIQTLKQPNEKNEKIIVDCVVNVFELSKIIDKLDQKSDAIIKKTPGGSLVLSVGKSIKIKLKEYDNGSFINIADCKNWDKLDHNFLVEMKAVSPVTDEFDSPVVYKDNILFLQNVKALFYKSTDKFNKNFSIDPKYLRKLLIDEFKEINVDNGQVNLRNESCRIYIPSFSGNTLDLRPLIKKTANYNIKCKVSSEDLKSIYTIIKELAEINPLLDQRVQIQISKDEFKIIFYDSEFIINNYIYDNDTTFDFYLALIHFRSIIKETFATRDAQYIILKLTSDNYNTFICENVAGVIFLGGLWRERK